MIQVKDQKSLIMLLRNISYIQRIFSYGLVCIIQIILLQLCTGRLTAQVAESMITEVIEGNVYVFKDFDARNKIKNFEIYKVGKILQEGNIYILPIAIYSYDENGRLQDSTHTSYKCERDGQQMLMTILFHAGKNSGSRINIIQTNTTQLYPRQINKTTQLNDFSYKLKIEGGFAGTMGASRDIIFYEREAKPLLSSKYSINGKMTSKTYVLGFKVSTVQYNYTETVEMATGIIFQKFIKPDGDYFTIELKE